MSDERIDKKCVKQDWDVRETERDSSGQNNVQHSICENSIDDTRGQSSKIRS